MTAAARQQSSVSRPHYWAAGALPAQARLAHSGSLIRYGHVRCVPFRRGCLLRSICLSVFCRSACLLPAVYRRGDFCRPA
eukprot:scaffold49703_cov76-Phaeocystis_antarctica.AAC.3